MITISSDPSVWANFRLRGRWMKHTSVSIVETSTIELKKRGGVLALYIITETAKYPMYVGAKHKKRALELIKKFKNFKALSEGNHEINSLAEPTLKGVEEVNQPEPELTSQFPQSIQNTEDFDLKGGVGFVEQETSNNADVSERLMADEVKATSPTVHEFVQEQATSAIEPSLTDVAEETTFDANSSEAENHTIELSTEMVIKSSSLAEDDATAEKPTEREKSETTQAVQTEETPKPEVSGEKRSFLDWLKEE